MRRRDCQRCDDFRLRCTDARFLAGNGSIFSVVNRDVQLQRAGFVVRTFDSTLHLDFRRAGIDIGQPIDRAPLGQVRLGRTDEPDIAIDARTGVPARIGIAAVVDPYGQHVVAFVQIGGQVVAE